MKTNKEPPIVNPLRGQDTNNLSGFLQNILESSTEYSIIGKDLDGKILLWNEGARRLYGYGPEEVVGKANSAILHTPEDVQAERSREITEQKKPRTKPPTARLVRCSLRGSAAGRAHGFRARSYFLKPTPKV
ncbi:MAG: PAS domain S-box protein [Verrucomicrobia bacterium]|nr:PAS domain S-box protein [Verrucomicrobiota bacterium]